jgi:hypothetical protein
MQQASTNRATPTAPGLPLGAMTMSGSWKMSTLVDLY